MASLLRTVSLIAAAIPATTAFWRMPCPSRLIQERIDPIISPGHIAAHVHTVSGGNGFGFKMDYAQARKSECSSCPIKQDLSAYWTPKLYFRAQNGSFIGVPQAGDYNGMQGGMTVYYFQRPGPKNDKLHAFPAGFRMIAGNPYKRNFTGDFAAQAISFNCLNYAGGGPPEGNALPNVNCPDGLRAQVFFPSCWDGKNLGSPDHESHMAYPASGAYNNGPCPASHPVHMISLFYEVIYSTGQFADMWYGNKQPFVFAQGDPSGYGFHGDFVNGWDVNVLQQAVDQCTNLSGNMQDCPVFQYFTDAQSQGCKVPVVLSGNIDGPRPTLPGCNPVQYGPKPAVQATGCGLPKVIAPSLGFKDLTSKGWKYLACGTDDVNSRTFTGASGGNSTMTVESCVNYCKAKKFSYAGMEYSTQCYCSNSLPSDRAPAQGVTGSCNMKCGGDSKEYCGGANALSIYQACSGGSACRNPTVSLPGGLPVG